MLTWSSGCWSSNKGDSVYWVCHCWWRPNIQANQQISGPGQRATVLCLTVYHVKMQIPSGQTSVRTWILFLSNYLPCDITSAGSWRTLWMGLDYFTSKHLWRKYCFELETTEKWQTLKERSALLLIAYKQGINFPLWKWHKCAFLFHTSPRQVTLVTWDGGLALRLVCIKQTLANDTCLPAVSP